MVEIDFHALSDYIFSFVITCFYFKNAFPGEYDDEGAFIVLEFSFSEQVQFKAYIDRVVENSMGYPSI
jgi:hypothetical protein